MGERRKHVVNFQIPVFFCSDRQGACRVTPACPEWNRRVEGFFLRCYRKA
jgi:hypothetical protein